MNVREAGRRGGAVARFGRPGSAAGRRAGRRVGEPLERRWRRASAECVQARPLGSPERDGRRWSGRRDGGVAKHEATACREGEHDRRLRLGRRLIERVARELCLDRLRAEWRGDERDRATGVPARVGRARDAAVAVDAQGERSTRDRGDAVLET